MRHTGGTHTRYDARVKRVYDWNAIQSQYDRGNGFVECSKQFGFSHSAWVKAIRRGVLSAAPRPFGDRRRRYDWTIIQAYVDAGFGYRECLIRFRMDASTWAAAIKRGALMARSRAIPLEV